MCRLEDKDLDKVSNTSCDSCTSFLVCHSFQCLGHWIGFLCCGHVGEHESGLGIGTGMVLGKLLSYFVDGP